MRAAANRFMLAPSGDRLSIGDGAERGQNSSTARWQRAGTGFPHRPGFRKVSVIRRGGRSKGSRVSLFDDDESGAPTFFGEPDPHGGPAARRPAPHRRRPMPYPAPGRHLAPTSVGQPRSRHASRRSRNKRRALMWRILTTAGSFVAVLALAAGALAAVAYKKYNGQITRVDVIATKDPNIRDARYQQHAANFLVIGSDTRAGADAKFGNVSGARSDTTILVHISPDRSKATVISIPRDSWVDIPSCTDAKGAVVAEHFDMFNSAFEIGGPKCTIATVQKLSGIAVTHFVEIDFSGFQSMVSAMGRVTICSPQPVFDPGSGLRLRSGNNQLDGVQALAYVRARETLGDGSDLGRIKRQQLFLGAMMRQATSGALLSSPAHLTKFLDAATKAITVDRATSFGDLRTLAQSMQGLDPGHVVFYTAPIADRNYSPPGTTMTGRVLLDDVKGRQLYDSVIHDTKPVVVTKGGSPTTTSPPPTANPKTPTTNGKTTAPADGTTAAQASCSL